MKVTDGIQFHLQGKENIKKMQGILAKQIILPSEKNKLMESLQAFNSSDKERLCVSIAAKDKRYLVFYFFKLFDDDYQVVVSKPFWKLQEKFFAMSIAKYISNSITSSRSSKSIAAKILSGINLNQQQASKDLSYFVYNDIIDSLNDCCNN